MELCMEPINAPSNNPTLRLYRFLVRAGYLRDDLVGAEELGPAWVAPRIVVDGDCCIGCFACTDVCLRSALFIWQGQAHLVDPTACSACPDIPCIEACPTAALSARQAPPPAP
jgi:ferredoxin